MPHQTRKPPMRRVPRLEGCLENLHAGHSVGGKHLQMYEGVERKMEMIRHTTSFTRTCMDCGKDFLAVIETESRKPLNCWYWGDMDLNMKNRYFIKLDLENMDDKDKPMWQRWLKEYVPDYCYPEEEPTVKPIIKRWILSLRGWLDRTPKEEMWTCPECVEREKKPLPTTPP